MDCPKCGLKLDYMEGWGWYCLNIKCNMCKVKGDDDSED